MSCEHCIEFKFAVLMLNMIEKKLLLKKFFFVNYFENYLNFNEIS